MLAFYSFFFLLCRVAHCVAHGGRASRVSSVDGQKKSQRVCVCNLGHRAAVRFVRKHARQERLPPISFLALRTQLLSARTIAQAPLYARIVGVRRFLRRFAGQLLLNHKRQCPCFVWGRWFLGQVRHHGWIFGPNFGMLDVQVGTGSRPDISSEFWAPRSAWWGRGVPEAGEGFAGPTRLGME